MSIKKLEIKGEESLRLAYHKMVSILQEDGIENIEIGFSKLGQLALLKKFSVNEKSIKIPADGFMEFTLKFFELLSLTEVIGNFEDDAEARKSESFMGVLHKHHELTAEIMSTLVCCITEPYAAQINNDLRPKSMMH